MRENARGTNGYDGKLLEGVLLSDIGPSGGGQKAASSLARAVVIRGTSPSRAGSCAESNNSRSVVPASSRLRKVAVSLVLTLGAATPCLAQGYPASQRARVEQTVAFTDISVAYGRPVARGRTLFGDSALVKWNAIWH